MNKFYKEAFKGYEVPEKLMNVSVEICNQFNIRGICDPMYISNVIAFNTGTGDGQSNFNNNAIIEGNFKLVSEKLAFSYGRNITSANDVEKLLLRNLSVGGNKQ
ncbi:hypothetical protein [Oceanobacillus oncorhynchi]|uniref:hypothetical protein n=1 Tax=Oceanobacillus oncorhynchi TaxID=545501 RepID=UPI0034D6AE67